MPPPTSESAADLVNDVRPLATRDDLHAAEIRVIGAVAAMLTVAVLILSFT
jgi:hypothetical protein